MKQAVWIGMGSYLVVATGACKRRRRGPAPSASRGEGGLRFLSASEFATLSAVCERLLPRDQDPGAIDLGVPVFIDRALAQDDYAQWRKPIRTGLALLDRDARDGVRLAFHLMRPAEQERLLQDWQQRRDPIRSGCFHKLLHLTLEGAFGDPGYGGNRDRGGWRLIGFVPDDACEERPIALGRPHKP